MSSKFNFVIEDEKLRAKLEEFGLKELIDFVYELGLTSFGRETFLTPIIQFLSPLSYEDLKNLNVAARANTGFRNELVEDGKRKFIELLHFQEDCEDSNLKDADNLVNQQAESLAVECANKVLSFLKRSL